jgi:hypothetical protein
MQLVQTVGLSTKNQLGIVVEKLSLSAFTPHYHHKGQASLPKIKN